MVKSTIAGSEAGFNGSDDEREIIITADGGITDADTGDAIPVIEPSTINFESVGSEAPKRRGRKPGSKNSTSKSSKETANDLTGLFLGIHTMCAMLTGIPELELEEEEAAKLAKAVARVNNYYGGMVIPEKYAVWGNFAVALGTVYGPRAITYRMRMKQEAQGKPVTINAVPINRHAN
jgi:hypothetical protein